MSKPRSSTPRYLQQRHEIITPGGKTGRRQWIVARSLCHYRCFSLTDIPGSKQDSVLQLQIQQWAPFQEYANYIVWQENYAQVWIWDKQQQLASQLESGVKKATVLPESVLYSPPLADSVQLLKCIEGFEGQIWQNGLLIGSRWWANNPSETEWVNFQRRHSLPANPNVPPPIEPVFLKRPWGQAKRRVGFKFLYRESLWVTLGIFTFTILYTWQGVSIWQWQQALVQLKTPLDNLTQEVAPILAARTQALSDQKKVEQLLDLIPYPSQLVLITQVAEFLPRQNTQLIEWHYQTGELQFTIETTQRDHTYYVENYQFIPFFQEVKAETGRQSNQIVLSMRLKNIWR
jgi:hypothetical protein